MTTAAHTIETSPFVRWIERASGPGMIVLLFLVSIVVINPFREISTMDDSWAYARTVQHLLSTGRYQLDIWSAANMPVQIYMAAGLSKVFGYSLSLLRCSTLALLVAGLFSFYALLRELSCSKQMASMYTLALLASPLILMLSFTFMSDVPFLAWLLIALWLYVRGLRHNSLASMLAGSIAAGCAIGTRQFGVVLGGGLVLCCLLSPRDRRPALRLVGAGLIVPILAAGLQFYLGLTEPNITQAVRLAQQHEFVHQPAAVLVQEVFWRSALIVQYTGMALLPVLPFVLSSSLSSPKSPFRGRRYLIAAILGCVAIVAALWMSSSITARPAAQHAGTWEPLEFHWMLPAHLERNRLVMHLLNLIGILGGAVLIATVAEQILRVWRLRRLSAEWAFLAGTAVGLFALHLIYVQLNDTYVASFIPFGLLIFAKAKPNDDTHGSALVWSAAISTILILTISLYIRSEDAAQTALWKGADELVSSGVRPDDIAAPLAWEEYHGAFDRWVADGTPGFSVPRGTLPKDYDPFHDPFYKWLRMRDDKVPYHVGLYPHPPDEWNPLSAYGYRSMFFHRSFAWVLKRRTAQ